MISLPRLRWPVASLSTYLVGAILLATVPLVLLVTWQLSRDIRSDEQQRAEELQRTALALAQGVDRELVSSIEALRILSSTSGLQRGDFAALRSALAAAPPLRASWHGLRLVGPNAEVLFDTAAPPDAAPGGRAPPELEALARRVMAEGRAQASDLVRQPGGGAATLVGVPVPVEGRPPYVLAATIDGAAWQRLLEASAPPRQGFLSLFDRQRVVVARTLEPQRFVGQSLPPEVMNFLGSQPAGLQRARTFDGQPVYFAWQRVPTTDWGVGVGLLAEPVDVEQRNALLAALGIAAACLVLGVTLALGAARGLLQPLQQLAETTGGDDAAGARRLAGPLPPSPVREVALLRDALAAAALRDEAARERLAIKAAEFETLFAASPIGLAFAQDPQCRTVLHNAAMDRLFGDLVAHAGDRVQVLHQGRPLERAEQPLHRAAALGVEVPVVELEIRVEGAAPAWVLANAAPLRDANGRPRGAIGAVVDISATKLAEEGLKRADARLRESQHLIELAQEAGGVGFFIYRFEPDAMQWTPGLAKLFGVAFPEGQPPATPLDEWLRRIDRADRNRVEHALRELVEQHQERATVEYRVTPPGAEGAERWLSSRLLLDYDRTSGRALQMIGVTVDMTEQQRVERERAALVEREQSARKEAEAANRAKDEFLAMLGHELRNPLSAIASAVELLNRVQADSPVAGDARRIIGRQTRHLAHMMEDLLDVGRVISGKVVLSRAPVQLAQIVRRVLDTLQVTGDGRAHVLGAGVLEDVWVDADSTRIEQVTSNLVGNALKYTPAGGKVEASVRRASDGSAVLEVEDSGVGIPPQLLPKVFDLFVQGERSLDRRAGGLGIGLTLVKRLVELHGGTVEAHSTPGQGSRFTVRLPSVAAPAAAQAPAPPPRPGATRRRTVGVVEDNPDALDALRSLLELDGHAVWTASDGIAGLASVLERRPDVAVIDIGLPGLDGFELAKRSRAGGYAGRMIALSGYGQERDVQQAMRAGFDAHLVKPVNPEDLRRMLVEE